MYYINQNKQTNNFSLMSTFNLTYIIYVPIVTGREKMNPLTVRVYDSDLSKVVHRFLDMCPTSGPNCGTAEVIYKKMDEAMQKNAIPWRNCVSLSVDIAPVNTGARNSIASRAHQEHGSIYIHGCPCHIIRPNTAKQAGQAFLEVSCLRPSVCLMPNVTSNRLLCCAVMNQ